MNQRWTSRRRLVRLGFDLPLRSRAAASQRASVALWLALAGCTPASQPETGGQRAPVERGQQAGSSPAKPSAEATPASAEAAGGTLPRTIVIGRSRIQVSLAAGAFEGHEAVLLGWIERCARAVAGYYGGFPVPLLKVAVRAEDGSGIHGGQTLPVSPPVISIAVGRRAAQADFEDNWSMTHEMVHLAFPDVPSAHHWLEEGLATYVEPIARARAGWITEEAVWAEWIENMPQGLPERGDTGLDGTDSWGRTYWGGALFCLLVDVELLERTARQRGLEDALRAIATAGGTVSQEWPLERALRTGDDATGTRILEQTYAAMKDTPVPVDLAALWRKLGVELDAGHVRYNDAAPLAGVRRVLVSGRR